MSEGRTAQDPGGTPSPSTAPARLGALLAALRLKRGWSQLRVAEQLTAAAGLHTVSRHEVSRWERGERVPGDFWLGWLAVVLDVPGGELAVAAEAARRGPARRSAPPAASAEGQAELLRLAHAWLADPAGPLSHATPARSPGRPDPVRGARRPDRTAPAAQGAQRARRARSAQPRGWLNPEPGTERPAWIEPASGAEASGASQPAQPRGHAAPGGPPARVAGAATRAGEPPLAATAPGGRSGADGPAGPAPSPLDTLTLWVAGAGRAGGTGTRRGGGTDPEALAATVAVLRRQDDLVGGTDLAGPAGRELGAALGRPAGEPASRRLLGLVAEAAQLVGWLAADAGDRGGALAAYRTALTAAAGAGDRPLAAHVLGSASHLLASAGDPREALLLARTGLAGAGRAATATLRALLLHRLAFAAALCGERVAAHDALGQAATVAARRDPAQDPPWLYWLDEAELSAMTGRCLAALRRPLRAEPLLTAAVRRTGQPRSAALYGAWLARVCLDLGEVERAGEVAGAALLEAVRSGSARAAAEVVSVRPRLATHRDVREARRFAELAGACRAYLPEVARTGPPTALEIGSD